MDYKALVDTKQGFTVDLLGQSPTSGYIVSLPGYTRRIDVATFNDEDVKDYASQYFYELSESGRYIGAWLENNTVWLDISENFHVLELAQSVGVERNQIAIWDVVNETEIATGGNGN